MNKNYLIEKTLRETFGDPIGSYAGDAPVGVRGECAGCGMSVEQCTCPESDSCPACGMMYVGGVCECGSAIHEAVGQCSECGMMEIDGVCECGTNMRETDGICSECGMMEVDGMCECGSMRESRLHEVAPEGYEKIVKALKKSPSVDNPWAVAWSMKKKGIKPKKSKKKKG